LQSRSAVDYSAPAQWKSTHETEGTPVKLYGSDDRELLEVSALRRDGDSLLLQGRILGMMPLSARLRPEEARAAWHMMDWRTRWFLFTLLFRRRRKA
jgi:hypothetical protein